MLCICICVNHKLLHIRLKLAVSTSLTSPYRHKSVRQRTCLSPGAKEQQPASEKIRKRVTASKASWTAGVDGDVERLIVSVRWGCYFNVITMLSTRRDVFCGICRY